MTILMPQPQGTGYGTWLQRRAEDPRWRPLQASRARRRLLVAVHVLLTAAFTAGFVVTNVTDQLWWLAPTLLCMVVWIPLMGMLNIANRCLFQVRDRMLDERQLAERGTGYRWAYRLSIPLMFAAYVVFNVAAIRGISLDAMALPIAVTAVALMELLWMLPTWFTAFFSPNEPLEDEATA